MFTHAIVRQIGRNFVNGLSTANLGRPDYDITLVQHRAYVNALQKCGVEVTILEPDDDFPDSTFVEDTAVVTNKCAVITNPGAPSRKGEIVHMRAVLSKFFETLENIQAPGTLDGGDVLQVDNHFYIGLSTRTNLEGAKQLAEILRKYGYTSTIVPLKRFLHLKTGVAYLGNGDLVVAGEFIDSELFRDFNRIIVDSDEEYAANCIRVNDFVIMPKGYEKTKYKIRNAGYSVIELEMSEFQKLDGGLSCLSLRF
jgi:dimethylargininase